MIRQPLLGLNDHFGREIVEQVGFLGLFGPRSGTGYVGFTWRRRRPIIQERGKAGRASMTVKVEPIGTREIEFRLLAFEEHFRMSSEHFVEAFRNGKLEETPEFHEWASLIAARKLVERRRSV